MVDVALVGEIYVDHIFSGFPAWPKPGEEVITDAYTREIGGGAANTACGLARLGRSVALIGLIGEADQSWFERKLAPFGVPTDRLRAADGETGLTVSISTREDRSFFTHLGVNRGLDALLAAPETLAGLCQARHVHFALPPSRATAAFLLPALRAAGCSTSLDVGFQPDWLADPVNHQTCAEVDHFLPNEKEAELFCGAGTPQAFFAFARRAGLRSATLKRGALGAEGEESAIRHAVTPPPVTAFDSTGAGDAFDAGFIDALLDGASIEERLRRACICGALSTRMPGALGGLPDRSDMTEQYQLHYGSLAPL